MFTIIVNYIFMYTIKYKFHCSSLLTRIFTKSNFSKVIILFTVGFACRVSIGFYYDVNVFLEYYETISLAYY